MNRLSILLICSLFASTLWAQNISIGQWQDELPYGNVTKIADAGDIIYGATPYSLFTFTKKDQVMERYSKIKGLSDIGISTIAYNKGRNTLMVAYSNTNIDLIKNGSRIVNIPDIKRKQILGKKTINAIYFHERLAYLSCGFGIVVIDIQKEEVKDTWYLGEEASAVEVFDISMLGDSIYAATEKGIKAAHLNADNLSDYNSWHQINNIAHPDGAFTHIINFKDKLVATYHPENEQDEIYVYENKKWTSVTIPYDKTKIFDLSHSDNKVFAMYRYSIEIFNTNFSYDRNIYSYGEDVIGMLPSYILKDNSNTYWVSDAKYGLLSSSNLWTFQQYQLNGPLTAMVYDMDAQGDRLLVTPGGRQESSGNNWNRDGIFTKVEGRWHNFSRTNNPGLQAFYDFVGVSINPLNTNQFAASSWNEGVAIFNQDGFVAGYDENNSPLTALTSENYVRVGDVVYDKEGYLWANCAGTPNMINRLSPDGQWTTWDLGAGASKDVGDMSIDSRGYKWIRLRQGSGYYAFIFDEKQPQGSQLKGINGSPGQGNVPGSQIWCMTEDLDGEMWIGSDQGVSVIYTPSNIFKGSKYDAQTIIVEHADGYARPLLQSEQVNAIAVDGANRKWIATEKSGVFLISADGMEEIHHFTEENSPLYSNTVKKLTISHDGTVYMGTTKGIIAYRGDASSPEETYTDVYAFPNPVRPNYHGPIAIKGLMRDVTVKITSLHGHLVSEFKSNGGEAIWNGKDLQGQRVKTGVYLVFVTNDTGTDTMVSKILFVN